ncbi:MAG: gliding motility protein GldM [Bacteroidales bacterium]
MAQPRLTPRQRMINMMYLVLTALLALNVSRETLDVIARVNRSLNQSVESFASKNNLTYAAFDNAYQLNKVKVGPYKAKADSVKVRSQKMIDKITEYKWAIVREADGKKANLDSIKSQDQLNIPAQIMLVDQIQVGGQRMSRAKDLRNSIEQYGKFLLTEVGQDDSVLIGSIRKSLTVADPPPTSRDNGRTWEQDNFEYLPLIGVITLMTKMQSDVRNAESDVLNYLYKNIDAQSFKFNMLNAVVIPTTSRTVVQGNPYEADVLLAAFDTTINPTITVGGQTIPYREGHGIYTVNTSKPGIFKWGGIINYTAPDGSNKGYSFNDEYEVIPPVLISAPTKMNAFYKGVANPLMINAIGASAKDIKVEMTNADIRQVGDFQYEVSPRKAEGEAVLTVTAIINGRTQTYPPQRYRLYKVPDPTAKVGGKNGGKIEKNVLQVQTGVVAELADFLFDMKFEVKGFKVTVSSAGSFVQDEPSNNALFTENQKKLIKGRKLNDRVIINDIIAVGPDGITRQLSSITFTVQ